MRGSRTLSSLQRLRPYGTLRPSEAVALWQFEELGCFGSLFEELPIDPPCTTVCPVDAGALFIGIGGKGTGAD